MDPLQTKIVEALESGKYGQCKGRLRSRDNPNCFCPAGVMLDQIDPNAWVIDGYGYWSWKGMTAILHDWVNNKLGLTTVQEVKVMTFNDKDDKNFCQIAAYLRTLWKDKRTSSGTCKKA